MENLLYLCHTNKTPMKVQLKNIKTNVTFSEETIMFNADLYINNKKIGYCSNDGRGGNTNYYGNTKEDYQIISECEEYFKSLPKKKHTIDGNDYEFSQTLESEIDDIISKYVDDKKKKKFQKKMEKDMLTKLVLGKGNPNRYEVVGWKTVNKKPITIEQMINHPYGKESLKKTIQNMREKGYTILNTNIPQEFFT